MSNGEKQKEESAKWAGYNWPKVLLQIHIHLFLAYSLVFLLRVKLLTLAFSIFLIGVGLLGATAGAHRLWTHRSYTANTFLRFLLVMCHTIGGTGTIYDWVLDHRIHHQYESTEDDPFNKERGFLYAHLGQKLRHGSPKREELIHEIDMTDIESDKIVMFQKRFYWVLMSIFCLLLPINAPVEYWGEDMLTSFMILGLFRIPVTLHAVWFINSARAVWELKPNDRFFIDSNLMFFITKNHWHAYHYSAPWDCLTGEFGSYNRGSTTTFLKLCAALGFATDLKTVNSKMMASALEKSLDSGKSVGESLLEVREEMELSKYEDITLDVIQSRT
ncbi:hypothetical protein RUM43_003697 [Polyplax serrata]|uniref:Uncharacterized protein n=1 Tax=Polyplax serrata TaxID=468196 RepID=A0AAN8PHN2_POLSC